MRRDRLHRLIIPGYVLLCLLLGGSVQGIWRNMVLQLFAVALIAWAVLSRRTEPLTRASRLLLMLAAAGVLLFVLQLIPLPPALWTTLPGREVLADGYAQLGYRLPWLSLSMTPYDTLATALTLLPPLAVVLGIVRLGGYQESWIAGALIIGALLNVLLGAVQSVGGKTPGHWYYLYNITNDAAVGFFANSNHTATLLLVTIPFAAALLASTHSQTKERGESLAATMIGAGGLVVVLVGLALNRSLAGLALVLPVLAASCQMLPLVWTRRLAVPGVAAVVGLALIASLATGSIRPVTLGADFTSSLGERQSIWQTTGTATSEVFPIGSGLGSFEQVYSLYEDPRAVGRTYVNNAHNDYMELVLETGLLGLLLISGFLLWWLDQTIRIWRSQLSSHFARAATIASAAVLVQSAVDYPLRTAAIAVLFAASLSMMAQPLGRRRSQEAADVRATKHVTIG